MKKSIHLILLALTACGKSLILTNEQPQPQRQIKPMPEIEFAHCRNSPETGIMCQPIEKVEAGNERFFSQHESFFTNGNYINKAFLFCVVSKKIKFLNLQMEITSDSQPSVSLNLQFDQDISGWCGSMEELFSNYIFERRGTGLLILTAQGSDQYDYRMVMKALLRDIEY